jgi:hypothetical protein
MPYPGQMLPFLAIQASTVRLASAVHDPLYCGRLYFDGHLRGFQCVGHLEAPPWTRAGHFGKLHGTGGRRLPVLPELLSIKCSLRSN